MLKGHHRDRKPHGHRIIVDRHGGKVRPPPQARESKRTKRAYKPGSVADGHLSWHARHRAAPRTLPGRGPGRPIAPLFALAPDGVYQAAALPRRWWSLTPPFQLFPLRAESARRWESSFLRHFPSGCPAWPLASILPCGARTFLTRAQGHVARPSGPLRARYCSIWRGLRRAGLKSTRGKRPVECEISSVLISHSVLVFQDSGKRGAVDASGGSRTRSGRPVERDAFAHRSEER